MRTLVGRVSGTVRSSPLRVLVAFTIILGLGGGRATADPRSCASVTADQATKAANLLPRGQKFFQYCPTCEPQMGTWQTIDTVLIGGSGSALRQVFLNGTVVVVGAIYYFGADGNAHNLARQVGCLVDGYPASIPLSAPTPTGTRRYTLGLRIDVMASQANGTKWDVAGFVKGGDAPDPILRGGLYRGNTLVKSLTCRQDNTFTSTCLSGTVVDADESLSLILDVKDWDETGDDDIGTVSVSLRDAIRSAGRANTARTSGQIKSATLSLTPVE